jgi:serine protease Do
MAKELGLNENTQGVVVTEVELGSPAQAVGIGAGDVIAKVGGKEVKSVEDYRAAVEKQSLAQGVRMQVSRGGVSRFVFLRALK